MRRRVGAKAGGCTSGSASGCTTTPERRRHAIGLRVLFGHTFDPEVFRRVSCYRLDITPGSPAYKRKFATLSRDAAMQMPLLSLALPCPSLPVPCLCPGRNTYIAKQLSARQIARPADAERRPE